MTEEAIRHIQALRDGLAAELSRDPRVLTLQSLDKTLAELKTIAAPAAAPDSPLIARLNAASSSRAASAPLSALPTARVA